MLLFFRFQTDQPIETGCKPPAPKTVIADRSQCLKEVGFERAGIFQNCGTVVNPYEGILYDIFGVVGSDQACSVPACRKVVVQKKLSEPGIVHHPVSHMKRRIVYKGYAGAAEAPAGVVLINDEGNS